jgi:hypothetical protein
MEPSVINMMKSYIFDCDDFIPDACGGTFVCGQRRFSLVISSSMLSEKILQHVKENSVFLESEYPPVVIAALRREGLLCSPGKSRVASGLLKWINSVQKESRRSVYGIRLGLAKDPFIWYFVCKWHESVRLLVTNGQLVVLNQSIVNAIVRPWSWIMRPFTIAVIGVGDLIWLASSHKFDALKTIGLAWYRMPSPSLVFVLLFGYLMVHEFSHAASAYNAIGKAGEIRMGRHLGVMPYLYAHLPGISACRVAERISISASGPVVQIVCSILLMTSWPDSLSVAYASELSVVIALVSLTPFKNTDAYWILVDLLGGRKPNIRLNWAVASKYDMVYTVALIILGIGFASMAIS